MNTPNKLTLLRIFLVPVFLLVLLCEGIPLHNDWALLVFALASATDAMDGHIARSRNLVTDFGKFLDPVADKVLVFAALIAFIDFGWASSVAVIIMIAREFLVSSLRMVAADNGTVIAAGKLGKLKTAVTMASIVAVLVLAAVMDAGLLAADFSIGIISSVLVWVSAVITVISGIEYLWKNRSQFHSSK